MNIIFISIIALVLTLNKCESESSTTECNVGEKKFQNGTKFSKDGDGCKICTCLNGQESDCKEIKNCDEMKCLENLDYENKCCEAKKCIGKI